MAAMTQVQLLPLELKGIACHYGRKVVLREADLRMEAGEIVALLGANGAGKTTLFSLIVGLIQPDGGERCFGGRSVEDVDLCLRARMAYVAHAPQLYPLLSAIENLELFAQLRGDVVRESPSEVLASVGLDPGVHDRPVSTYSRGMAQRVVLARALASSPDLLILDEPFTSLDREGREMLVRRLRDERDKGMSILLSSHDVDAASAVSDRAVLLEDGIIAAEARRGRDSAEQFGGRILALGGILRSPEVI